MFYREVFMSEFSIEKKIYVAPELVKREKLSEIAAAIAPTSTATTTTFAVSDRRLKRNISQIGILPNGLNLYQYKYVWSESVHTGVMADEVELLMPEAVIFESRLGALLSAIILDFVWAW
eukprot:gene18326-18589_t